MKTDFGEIHELLGYDERTGRLENWAGYDFAPNDSFFVGAFINNAFNKTVFTNTFPPPLTNGLVVAALRSPRTYGIPGPASISRTGW